MYTLQSRVQSLVTAVFSRQLHQQPAFVVVHTMPMVVLLDLHLLMSGLPEVDVFRLPVCVQLGFTQNVKILSVAFCCS